MNFNTLTEGEVMGLKGDIVKEYLSRFPNTPNRSLAQLIYKENKAVFKNEDSVRWSVRYYTGAAGKHNLKRLEDRSMVTGHKPLNPFDDMPEGLTSYDDWSPFDITDKKTLVIGDAHIPYHDIVALRAALEYGVEVGVDAILMLGDMMDFFSVSFWEKDPRERDLQNELDTFYSIMRMIRGAYPSKTKIYYKIGNHEERFDRYIRVKAPELLGLEYLSFGSILHADEFNMEIIGDRRVVKIGKLHAIHGHEFGRSFTSPVNPARGLYLKGKEHCIAGHHHQSSAHNEKSMAEDVIGCWSYGCLCDLHPDYMPMNKWNHGFAVVTLQPDGGFFVENKTIFDGKVY